jgi:hypothetical protein
MAELKDITLLLNEAVNQAHASRTALGYDQTAMLHLARLVVANWPGLVAGIDRQEELGHQAFTIGIAHQEHAERVEAHNRQLRDALKQALRQWEMYAEMSEARDEFDFKSEKSPEADLYRDGLALVASTNP